MSHLHELSKLLDAHDPVRPIGLNKNKPVHSVQDLPGYMQPGLPPQDALASSPLFYKPFGACGTVTGSAHFVYHSASGKCFAVDCGLLQGEGGGVNDVSRLPIPPKALHAVFLTHAHVDHIGNLFAWLRAGFRGRIYCTDVTSKLTLISLRDALNRQPAEEGDEALWELLPTLFVCPDRESLASHGRMYQVEGAPGLRYSFTPTSHLIGCAALRLLTTVHGQGHADIIFTGDIGPVTDAEAHGGLSPARQLPVSFTGVVVLESTYGDRQDRDPATLRHEDRLAALAAVIKDAVAKGPRPRLIIPAFSLGRTTDLLVDLFMVLATMRAEAGLSAAAAPVINIESPLASQYADVLSDAYAEKKGTGEYSWLNPHARILVHGGLPLLQRLLSASKESKQEHETQDGKVVVNWGKAVEGEGLTVLIAGSGTTLHGRVCREIMEHAKSPEATVLLCGYCPETSLGGQLREIVGLDAVGRSALRPLSMRIADGPGGKPRHWEVPADEVRINLSDLSAYYSGHADASSLTSYALSLAKPAQSPMDFILVHGSNRARAQLAAKLRSGLGAGHGTAREVHCPSSAYPWFDVARKKWCFEDLGVLRSSMRVNVRERLGEGVSSQRVAGVIANCLARSFGLPTPSVRTVTQGAGFELRSKSSGTRFSHEVVVIDLGDGEFDLRVDSVIGLCQSNEDFKARCFPWEAATAIVDGKVSLGYEPVGREDEAFKLLAMIRDARRDYPVLVVTKLGNDNACAKFLSKSLMLHSGVVRLVTVEGRAVVRDLGLDLHSGVGLFFDERPGHHPVQFSILNPLDSARLLLDCLNRLEDARRLKQLKISICNRITC